MATLDTIKNILNENLDIDPETVGEESTFESLGIDSLDMVELICALEEACEVDFGEPETLETVGAALRAATEYRLPKATTIPSSPASSRACLTASCASRDTYGFTQAEHPSRS